jgi:hypothetical protein
VTAENHADTWTGVAKLRGYRQATRAGIIIKVNVALVSPITGMENLAGILCLQIPPAPAAAAAMLTAAQFIIRASS